MAIGSIGMLIDTSKCIGCRGCQIACKEWNQNGAEKTKNNGSYENPPDLTGKTWTKIKFMEKADSKGNVQWLFSRETCLHCSDSSCLAMCPTGAIKRNSKGIVWYDQTLCNGCKYCVKACPFDVPRINADTGTAQKCSFCIDRVEAELTPSCAKTCPTGALVYGNRDELVQRGKEQVVKLIKSGYKNAQFYGDTQVGGLHKFYVLLGGPEEYELPREPRFVENSVLPDSLASLTAVLLMGMASMAAFRERTKKGGSNE